MMFVTLSAHGCLSSTARGYTIPEATLNHRPRVKIIDGQRDRRDLGRATSDSLIESKYAMARLVAAQSPRRSPWRACAA